MLSFLWFVAFCVAFAMLFGLRSRMRLVEIRVFGASPVPFEFRQMVAPGVAMSVAAPPPPAEASARGATAQPPFPAADPGVAPQPQPQSQTEPVGPAVDYETFLQRVARPEWRPDPVAFAPQPEPVAPEAAPPGPHRFVEPDRWAPFVAEAAATLPFAADSERPAPAAPRVRRQINWELFAGGRLLNVAGALAIVVGVALLMKYALDENWINATMRVALGLVVGVGLLGGGHLARAKRVNSWFAQGISGAGIGVLYASGYAAFDGYHLVPSLAAYTFLSLVTLAAFGLALRYDSIGLAVVGWAGGFATPFVTGGGSTGVFGLASYLLVLDSGLLAISLVKRRWFALQPLAIAGSYITALAWYVANGASQPAIVSAVALTSLWLVFFAAELFDVLRDPERNVALRTVASIANVTVFYAFLQYVFAFTGPVLETVTLIAAAGYAAAYALLARRAPHVFALRSTYAFASSVLAALACYERFAGETLVAVYALVGLAVAAIARLRRGDATPAVAVREAAAVSFGFLLGAYVAEFVVAVIAGDAWNAPDRTHDVALVALALASFGIDRLMRVPLAEVFGTVARQVGALAVVALEAAHLHGFALGDVLAFDALAFALVERVLRARGLRYGAAFEALGASAVAMLAAAFADMTGPGAFAVGPFRFDAGGRDVAFIIWTAAAFGLAALLRDGSRIGATAATIARTAGAGAIAALESVHVSGYGLAILFAGDAVALALADRVLRATGRRTGPAFESVGIASAFYAAGLFVDFAQANVFDFGSLQFGPATRDTAFFASLVAAFALERLFIEGQSRPAALGATFRFLGLGALAAIDAVHARGFGLAVLFALEGASLAAVDRALRAVGSRFAPAREAFFAGVAFLGLAWLVGVVAALFDPAGAAAGHRLALGFGGVDLALVALLGVSLLYGKLAAADGFAGPVLLALRQSAVATLFAAIGAHFAGFEACDALAVAAVGLSFAANRTRARDLRVDGAAALGAALLLLAIDPATWQPLASARLVPFLSERFAAVVLASIATFVTSELYLRSNGAVPIVGRGGRVAAFLIAIVGATLEVRDAFAAALATLGAGSAAYARLENLEQLSISGVWIAASLALVAFGIRFRVREVRVVAIGLFDLTILKAFFIDLHSLETPYRIASFIGLGIALLVVSFVYQRLEKGFFAETAAPSESF